MLSDTRTASSAYFPIPFFYNEYYFPYFKSVWDSTVSLPLSVYLYFFDSAFYCVALISLGLTVDGLELVEICLFLPPMCWVFLKDRKWSGTGEMAQQVPRIACCSTDLKGDLVTLASLHTRTHKPTRTHIHNVKCFKMIETIWIHFNPITWSPYFNRRVKSLHSGLLLRGVWRIPAVFLPMALFSSDLFPHAAVAVTSFSMLRLPNVLGRKRTRV